MSDNISGKMDILVVDDDPRIGKMFSEIFKDDGHNVFAVTTGEEAVAAYKKRRFGLVFLDMILPGMDGLAVLKALKETDKDAKVVLMTGYSLLGIMEDAKKAGIITTLIKPFHIEQVKNVVRDSAQAVYSVESPAKMYNALIIDDQNIALAKFESILAELNFKVSIFSNILDAEAEIKGRDFELIIINSFTLRKNTMETLYYIKSKTSTSKCILLIDEYMNTEEVKENIKELFRGI